MSRTIPYDSSFEALLKPCAGIEPFDAAEINSDAVLCAELARLVYCRFEDDPAILQYVTAQLEVIGFDPPEIFNHRSLQGFVAADSTTKRAVLVFRGTEPKNPEDVFTDLDANLVSWAGQGSVHQGFAKSLAGAWPDIEAILNRHRDKQFLYTGRSLAAALATLAAALRRPEKLISFGSPRVGNDAFVESIANVDHERYVDCCDGVCKVPPKLASYRHAGKKKYINRHGALIGDSSTLDVVADQAKAEAEYLLDVTIKLPLRHFADHAPINYIYALRAIGL